MLPLHRIKGAPESRCHPVPPWPPMGNLAAVTGSLSDYILSRYAAGSGVVDAAGNPLAGDAATVLSSTRPADHADHADQPQPEHHPDTPGTDSVQRTGCGRNPGRAIASRNEGPNLLTSSQTLKTNDNRTFTLGNLAAVTDVPGTELTFSISNGNGSGIADAVGNTLLTGASASFVVNVPAQVTTAADLGPGSLRQALLDSAVRGQTVGFDVRGLNVHPGQPGANRMTDELPAIVALDATGNSSRRKQLREHIDRVLAMLRSTFSVRHSRVYSSTIDGH